MIILEIFEIALLLAVLALEWVICRLLKNAGPAKKDSGREKLSPESEKAERRFSQGVLNVLNYEIPVFGGRE